MKEIWQGALFAAISLALFTACPTGNEEDDKPPHTGGPALAEQRPASELDALFSGMTLAAALKGYGDHNPIITHNFGADPWVLVYQDRAYMYITGDALQYNSEGAVVQATYGQIRNLHVLSSADLANWQDHGDIKIGGPDGLVPWANNGNGNAWAPCAAYRQIGGKTKFFVYWADNSRGIGVLTADSPAGPWVEPLGNYLVSRDTPACSAEEVPWLFDPAVLIDDDGSAYLYFGGGVDGLPSAEYTNAARVVKLSSSMIGLAEDPRPLNEVRYLFEDSGINKIGDTYYYSYCTNQQAANGFSRVRIAYMTSSSPYGPFTYPAADKEILYSPSALFPGTIASNNHHAMFEFKGKWYIAYHTQTLEKAMKDAGVLPDQLPRPSDGTLQSDSRYRNVHLDEMTVNSDGTIAVVNATRSGLARAADFDPYQTVEAETSGVQAGLNFAESGGRMAVTDIHSGGWLALHGVNFGGGANTFTAKVKAPASGMGALQLRLDSLEGEAAGYVSIKRKDGETANGYSTVTVNLPQPISGVHDLIFVFYGEGWEFDQWQFGQ